MKIFAVTWLHDYRSRLLAHKEHQHKEKGTLLSSGRLIPQALFIRIFSFPVFASGALGDAAAIKGRAASYHRNDRRIMREDLIRNAVALHNSVPRRSQRL
jgi:hypothetical protein